MSLQPKYFEDVYAANADPWDFQNSPYEKAKYDATLRALPRPRHDNAWEIGCSIGILTHRLGERCGQLLSIDVNESALDQARVRCADQPHVSFVRMEMPREEPTGEFDLIMMSEVAYYWSREDLEQALNIVLAHLVPKGQLLLVHYTPVVPDYPLTGDQVHELFLHAPGLHHLHGERADEYRLDLFEKA